MPRGGNVIKTNGRIVLIASFYGTSGEMDIALQHILINTYNSNPTSRHEAENALKQFLLTPNFLAAFFVVIDGYRGENDVPTLHHDIRTAACLVVKNNLRQYWVDLLNDGKTHPLSQEEREFCKEKLLSIALKETDSTLKCLLAESIRIICESDYPEKWPYLLPALTDNLKSTNILLVGNSLLILRQIVKRFEFRFKEARQVLDDIINTTFPIIQPIVAQLQDNNHIEAAYILRLCLKIFWSYTLYSLPIHVQSVVDVNLWFEVLRKLISKRLPEASEGLEPSGQPTDPDERRKWPWWKLKKWVSRIIVHFIQKYGNPRHAADEYQQFATHFRSTVCIHLLEPIFYTLNDYYTGRSIYITDVTLRDYLTFVSNCAEMSPSYKVIKPHLDFVLYQVVFPSLCLKPDELSLFTNDPQEFLQLFHENEDRPTDPRAAARQLLQSLAKFRQKDVVPKLLPFIQGNTNIDLDFCLHLMIVAIGILSEYNSSPPESRNFIKKDGVLVIISYIFKILSDSKQYNKLVEPFIVHHVVSEFQSAVPLLRFRACWVVQYFSSLSFETPGLIQAITSGLLNGLRDPTTPVQAAAACSLRLMMESDETTEILRPSVNILIGEYFRIMKEVESDSVLSALQAVIEKFNEDIYPLAKEIVSHLVVLFEEQCREGQEDEEATFSAIQSLDTILAVLEAISEDHPDILESLQADLVPLIDKILRDSDLGFEYADNFLEILSHFTYYCNNLSESCWSLLRTLLFSFDDWAFDYIGEITTPLINFITRDVSLFLRYQYSEQESAVQAMYRLFDKTFQYDTEEVERSSKHAADTISCLIIQCKSIQPKFINSTQAPDTLNPLELFVPTLKLIVPRLRSARTKRLRIKMLEVLMSMMYYDFEQLIHLLNQDPTTRDYLFTMLFDYLKEMDDVFSERLIVVAFANIISFQLRKDLMPDVIRSNLQPIFTQILREIQLIEEEESNQKNKENQDSDEDIEDDDDSIEEGDDDDIDDYPGKKQSTSSSRKAVVPDDGFDEEEDCIDQEAEDYLRHLEKINKMDRVREELRRANGGEPIDDEEDDDELTFSSPIDKIDLVVYLHDALQVAYTKDAQAIISLQQSLNQDDTVRLRQYMATVDQRRIQAASN